MNTLSLGGSAVTLAVCLLATTSSAQDGADRVRRLAAELTGYAEAVPSQVGPDGRLRLTRGLYPELTQPLEAWARTELKKTKTEFLALEAQVELGSTRAPTLTPIADRAGQYRVVIGQRALAGLGGGGHSGSLPASAARPRYARLATEARTRTTREAEARRVFDTMVEAWANKAATPAEAARIRALRLTFDRNGPSSDPVAVTPGDGSTPDTVDLQGWFLDEVGKEGASAVRERQLRDQINAMVAQRLGHLATPTPARGLGSPLDPFRRADRTVDYRRAVNSGALQRIGGVTQFTMALFLKELAVTVKTGDPQRLDEFFQFLTSTDFFLNYGLFAAGSQVGTVAYNKFLAKHIKPRFVSGILRTNLILATGMALPALVQGRFDGKAFAIDMGSLGLSTAAVRTAVQGIAWVTNLKKAEQAGRLARAGVGLRRLAKAGGWFYTAAELAVVLYLSDEVSTRIRKHLDEREARDDLGEATTRFLGRALDPKADARALEEALGDFGEAHADYRNHLYRGLDAHGATYASRMADVARKAKLLAEERAAFELRMNKVPALKKSIERRFGDVDGYFASKHKPKTEQLERALSESMVAFERGRAAELEKVYSAPRRDSTFALDLSDPDRIRWIADGAKPGATGDPYDGRTDFFARKARGNERRTLVRSAGAVSGNRLQAYEDERALLTQLRPHLKPELRTVLDAHVARLQTLEGKERALFGTVSSGLAKALGKAR